MSKFISMIVSIIRQIFGKTSASGTVNTQPDDGTDISKLFGYKNLIEFDATGNGVLPYLPAPIRSQVSVMKGSLVIYSIKRASTCNVSIPSSLVEKYGNLLTVSYLTVENHMKEVSPEAPTNPEEGESETTTPNERRWTYFVRDYMMLRYDELIKDSTWNTVVTEAYAYTRNETNEGASVTPEEFNKYVNEVIAYKPKSECKTNDELFIWTAWQSVRKYDSRVVGVDLTVNNCKYNKFGKLVISAK